VGAGLVNLALRNFSLIMDALASAANVSIVDELGRIKWANEALCDSVGSNKERLIGQVHSLLCSSVHSKEFYDEVWRLISSGQRWNGEIQAFRAGELLWMKVNICPSFDEVTGEKEYVIIHWDVSEAKEKDEYITALMSSSENGLLVYRREGQVIWENAQIADMLGRDSTLGKNIFEVFPSAYKASQEGCQDFVFENPFRRVVEFKTKPFLWKGQAAFLLITSDITEKVNLESRLIKQDRLSSLGLMAASFAHEVGTPLSVIRGRAELAALNLKDPEKVLENLEVIQEQVDRLSGLIRSLLEPVRSSDDVVARWVYPFQVANKVKAFLKFETAKQRISFQIKIDPKMVVYAEENAMFQVFLNLAMNSIHSFKSVGKRDELKITLEGKEKWSSSTVILKDNGCGISREHMSKIFIPFFTSKEVGEGTGLGLVVSRKMIRSWGGELALHSEEGLGTEAVLNFPKVRLLKVEPMKRPFPLQAAWQI